MHKIQINKNERTYCEALETQNEYQSVNLSSFHKAYKSIKIKYLKHKFLSNISRGNTLSKPHQFELRQKQPKLLNCTGWYINQTFTNVILLLDVMFTLANFIVSAFEAFLIDYQSFKLARPSVSVLNICAVVVYLFRIGLSLITIEVENGIQFVYIVDIVKKQLFRGRFFIELSFTAIVIIVILNQNQDHVILFGVIFFTLCIPKLYVLTQSFYKIEVWLINTLKRRRYWDLLKILLYNIFLAHFMASIILSTLYFGKDRNWYETKPFAPQNIDWFELYLWAYYWACTMMITVGFGDFVPANVEEAVVISFLQIMSSIIIAYNISQIGSIIQEITQGNHQVNSKIGLLRRMNKENTVSHQVNLKIEEYIVNEVKIEEEFEYLKHHGLINSLPEQLQTEYYKQAQKNIFGKLPFFVSLSTETLINFFMQLSGKVYYPEEYVMTNHNNQEITIILKGTIGFCCRKSDSLLSKALIETLKINYSSHKAMLLNNSLLNRNQGVDFDIKAIKYSYAIKFGFQTFISILKQNQQDYHFYLMTLDAYQLQNSISIQKCQYCAFSFHSKFQCPKLHFMPFKSIVISKYNENASFCNNRVKLFWNKSIRRNKTRHSYLFKESFRQHSSIGFIHANQWYSCNLIKIVSNKLLQVNLDNFEVISEEFQELDQLFDFQFYFPRSNPSRLKNSAIHRKKYQSKRGQKQKRVISEISMVLS